MNLSQAFRDAQKEKLFRKQERMYGLIVGLLLVLVFGVLYTPSEWWMKTLVLLGVALTIYNDWTYENINQQVAAGAGKPGEPNELVGWTAHAAIFVLVVALLPSLHVDISLPKL